MVTNMETMKKAPRLTNEEDVDKETLDAVLWGKLQEHIPLQTIYEKLSQRDLFRMRLVSKEWNHAALQWLLPKPSFVTIAAGSDPCDVRYLNGIVSYNSASGKCKFHRQRLRLPYVESHVPPFEVEGLILCNNPDNLEQRGVFNVHTRTWHVIPPGPEQSKSVSACGLLVDTTSKPYAFKLIEGNLNFKTQIYDSESRSWSKASSRLLSSSTESLLHTLEYSCICNNGNVYMSLGRHMILKYSVDDDKWTKLKFPKLRFVEDSPPPDHSLGVWDGRVFTTRENCKKRTVTVWELVDSEGLEWVEYARMPKEQYDWLWGGDDAHHVGDQDLCLRSFFRDGYLLVCSWRWNTAYADVLELFNMATKTWRKVDLPMGTVAADEHECGNPHEGDDVEEDEDFDEDDGYFDEFDDVDELDDVDEYVYVQEYVHDNVDEDDDVDEDDEEEEEDADEDDEVDEGEN